MAARAPAKVNLALSVGPLRADGYHDLRTVFCALDLADEVTVEPAGALTVEVHGEGAGDVPTDRGNLAVRAVELLAAATGADPAVRLRLDKRIPVAGGCAGGSADAAATLVACDALWGTRLPVEELAALGAQLGSDVPFGLRGGVALGTGRGERLQTVPVAGTYAWVLALADGGLSTPAVYAELDRLRRVGSAGSTGTDPGTAPAPVLAALRAGDPVALGRALRNDLQPAALSLRPGLAGVLAAGRDLGALGGVVSGSGPTVALLARDGAHAASLAAALAGRGVCRDVRTAVGPAPGAALVPAARAVRA